MAKNKNRKKRINTQIYLTKGINLKFLMSDANYEGKERGQKMTNNNLLNQMKHASSIKKRGRHKKSNDTMETNL